MITYADYSEFTQVYSVKGVSEAAVNSQWLPYGALRVNEGLGSVFTLPFSTNNQSAKDLSIHYAYLGLLLRTRNQTDSEELLKDLNLRITDIRCGNQPMITTTGEAVYPESTSRNDFWSTTQNYKPVFDMRDSLEQRIDPDQLDDERASDV